MIIAEVRDNGMGKWLVLECQHPVKTGRHVVLGGKSHPEMLASCGHTFTIGPFTENDKLADKIEEHEDSHRKGDKSGDGAAAAENLDSAPDGSRSGTGVVHDLGSYRTREVQGS